MANLIKIKRGLNIPVNGRPIEMIGTSVLPKEFALIPEYYHGVTPKLLVKEGDEVKAGTPVFHEKQFPGMHFVSPVSGKVKAINRGERRKIISIIIQRDDKMIYESFDKNDLLTMTAEDVIAKLQQAGLWPYIKQRPYDVIANPGKTPKAIFISAFDTAPLAPNNDYVMSAQMADFQTGIDALSKIAKIHLGI
ncbi:MAG: NADH:ubiquinone reductase (Na(+)-transporting) subunit A, partial [Paludibacter sp.]|nr:NADH:ubiquinone reductase (Na(+)-transporting) subunit A [Paludibacter sp.]